MSLRSSASLARRFPRHVEVPVLVFASGVLLALGVTQPAFETRTLLFWHDQYSIVANIADLWRRDRRVAAALLAACAIGYPAAKLLVLGYFWIMPFPARWRSGLIRALRLLGRWSMVDVFAITAIIVASRTIGPIQATPRDGLYLYAAGILCLMVLTLVMDRLARCGR